MRYLRRNISLAAAVLALGAGIPLSTFGQATPAKTITWPGDVEAPMSLYLSSGYNYLAGRLGETIPLVGMADVERAPTSTTDPPINDNKVGGSILQVGQITLITTTSIHGGHVAADMVVEANESYTRASDGKALGSQKSSGIAHFDVSPCPEVDGVAGGHISIQLRQETTFPDGSHSSSTSLAEGPFRIINGDDAHRVRTEVDLQVSGGSLHTPPSASGTDPVAWELTGPLNLVRSANEPFGVKAFDESQWKGSGSFSKDDAAHSPAEDLVQGFMLQLDQEVEKFWRSGKCIHLKPSEKDRKVTPQEKISLTVEAEQHFDHKEVKAPIKAEFTGEKSIDPMDKPVDEPAKFDFVAGGKRDDRGYINLTQTGKRGIGKASLTFTVDARDLLFSLTETIRRQGANVDVLLQYSLPPTLLTLQDDGSYRGTGSLAIKHDIHQWRTHAFGEGVNQLTIQARPSGLKPKQFYVQTSLKATPFTITQIYTNLSIPNVTYPYQLEASLWSDTFPLELDKVDRYQRGGNTIERTLREAPDKP